MNVYGVIMAGGGGTRFWPLSRKERPKQLLNLSGRDLMINETVARLERNIDNQDIYIVTNESQTVLMEEAVAGKICSEKILSEPSARNTAACIGYAAVKIVKEHGDGVMVITPSDAYIRDTDRFAVTIEKAVQAVAREDALVTIGIEPTFPATGYGYIKYDEHDDDVKKVTEFKEKPDLETATQYLLSGNYVWNSGMFIWRASTILAEFRTYLPDIYENLMQIAESIGTQDEKEVLNKIYPTIRSISIDYGIMEQSNKVLVIPAEFGWSDVGSWDMLGTVHQPDENGNVIVGEQINIDTTNVVSYSEEKLIATIGVSGLIIVESSDAILVCDKKNAQDVKKVVDILKEKEMDSFL